MACPYAEQIKGTIAKCSLLNRKVSTMRYPCKGNYRRCPVYIRRAAQRETVREALPEQPAKPKVEERPPAPVAPSIQEERESPRVEERVEKVEARREAEVTRPVANVFKPSKALCDSLVLASLTVSSKAEGIYRGPLSGLVNELKNRLTDDIILFVVGDYRDYKIRLLFKGGTARYSLEKGGNPICGDDAEKILEEIGLNEKLDGVIYSVKLSDIPLWKDQILGELG